MQKHEFHTKICPQGTIELPKHLSGLTNHDVRVVLYDFGSKKSSGDKNKLFGALHKYANQSKIPNEKPAITKALKQKHDSR